MKTRFLLEVFVIWPVVNQGREGFCSFGAVGECTKHAYTPSLPAHNAFFLQARPKRKTLMCSSTATI
jgi:hypothetical protein